MEMVIALILTALDALIFRESNSDLLLPTIIGGLQVILVAVATYLPLFAMVVVPANFLALTFLPTEQAPMQIFCALLIVEVMRANNNKMPARITALLLLVISNYDVNTSTFARDHVATFVTTLLFVIAYAIGMMRSRYKEQRRQATIESNRALEEQRLELATVLHDSTAKSFTRVTMLAQALAIEREGTDEKLEESLEDIAETSREGLLQLRQLLSLLKSADEESSLTSAIGQDERVPSMNRVLQQAKDELQEAGFNVSLATRIETEPSLTQISEVISPALSEFCTNIQKYGEPQTNVHILALGNEEDGFTLDISNQISKALPNFLPRAMLSSGLGLSSLHRRVRPWDGSITSEREGNVWNTKLHMPPTN
ncbi:hypothetical protein HMPREF2651_06365 [Corynebacterium sp. HMSC063A05]|nr:histidine kinase family protein [Corynebacterium sp. ATCC 6931]KAA9287452.1 hypothetical protein F6I11_08105 [Corynebacterium amycolatum]OFM85110.1 hypothetical protein HMPREF2651_06365 [Corynebacterium sp. HMSC063A05]OFU55414.1 hypothetical protein HMPREF3122_06530 [Corynebacterium sp. HMSC11H10]OHR39677.1 hypothetical protein HMPREF3011_09820 [Corynebacterium sp. HMSC074C04]